MASLLPLAEPAGAFLLVLAAALLAPLAAEKLRLPGYLGVVGLGLLLGPRGLGLLGEGGLTSLLGELGLIYLFFSWGLDTDLAPLRRKPGAGAAYGLLATGLSLGLGWAAGTYLLGLPSPGALALGLIAGSPFLPSRQGSGQAGSGKASALAVASGAGALSACLRVAALALFAALRGQGGLGLGPLSGTLAALLLGAILALLLPRLAALFFRKARLDGRTEYLFVLSLALLAAYAGGLVGLEPAAAAFLAGLLLGRFAHEGSLLSGRLRFAGEGLFLPFFLVSLGASLDPAALRDPALPLLALAFLGLLTLPKLLAAWALGPLFALGRDERSPVFGSSLEQAGSALAVAALGRGLGLAGDLVLGGAVLGLAGAALLGELLPWRQAALAGGPPSEEASAEAARAEEGARRGRIMVSIANPASFKDLLDLGFLLRPRSSKEALYPVAVVSECEDTERVLARAENLLARTILAGEAAGVPVRPSARASLNVHEGILEAADEIGADTLVLGWNRPPRLSRAFFGSVIEQVLRKEAELVVVARLGRPLESVSRLILVAPPAIEGHPGLPRGLEALGSVLGKLGAHLSVYAQRPHGAALKRALSGLRARGPAQVLELDSWKLVAEAARGQQSGGQPAFAVLCSRPGGAAWHPASDKLPHALAAGFPEAPLLLFYLPEAPGAAPEAADATLPGGPGAQAAPAGDLFERALAAGRVKPAMGETAVTDGIRALLQATFGSDRRALGRLVTRFTELAQKEPIEIEPGVLLLHAHLPEVEEPLVFFGAKPEGFRILALEEPVRVLIVLCAPESQGPEAHLATLGELARLLKNGELAARLLRAKSPAELAQLAEASLIVDPEQGAPM